MQEGVPRPQYGSATPISATVFLSSHRLARVREMADQIRPDRRQPADRGQTVRAPAAAPAAARAQAPRRPRLSRRSPVSPRRGSKPWRVRRHLTSSRAGTATLAGPPKLRSRSASQATMADTRAVFLESTATAAADGEGPRRDRLCRSLGMLVDRRRARCCGGASPSPRSLAVNVVMPSVKGQRDFRPAHGTQLPSLRVLTGMSTGSVDHVAIMPPEPAVRPLLPAPLLVFRIGLGGLFDRGEPRAGRHPPDALHLPVCGCAAALGLSRRSCCSSRDGRRGLVAARR